MRAITEKRRSFIYHPRGPMRMPRPSITTLFSPWMMPSWGSGVAVLGMTVGVAPVASCAPIAIGKTLGTISLALVPNRLTPRRVAAARRRLTAAADGFLAEADRTGYHVPLAGPGYEWGSNSDVLNRALVLGLASDFTGERRYADGVADALDYILGRNPLDRSFVAGFGVRPMRHSHHRFWHDSARYPPPPPGALSGGPNNLSPSDDVARALRGACAPQTCWRDGWRAFSLSEVAINLNAPLVRVAAIMAEGGDGG